MKRIINIFRKKNHYIVKEIHPVFTLRWDRNNLNILIRCKDPDTQELLVSYRGEIVSREKLRSMMEMWINHALSGKYEMNYDDALIKYDKILNSDEVRSYMVISDLIWILRISI